MSDIIGVVVTESSGLFSNLTVGKFYEVTDERGLGFGIKDDNDDEIWCLWDHCAFGFKYKPIYEEPRVPYWDYMLKGGQGDQEVSKGKVASDGGPSDYYDFPEGCATLNDLIEYKGMSFAQGNIFKAAYRLGNKEGITLEYDLKKIKYYADRMLNQLERIKND